MAARETDADGQEDLRALVPRLPLRPRRGCHRKAIEPNRRIVIEWPGYSGRTTVEWTFTPQPDGNTFVGITKSGFNGDGDSLVKQMTESTQGFSLVLAGLKAYLEDGIELELVRDRFPKGLEKH